jgi:translation initiation factor 4E
MKFVASFSTAEEFWEVYQHLRRPSSLPVISDYHVFKQGIKPIWEDGRNANGGKWIVRLKKGIIDRLWENLVLALIGDEFNVGDDICGAVLSLRTSEDIISIWNQTADAQKLKLKIRNTLKNVLNLPNETIVEYKAHKDAMVDNSSFRNTDVFR